MVNLHDFIFPMIDQSEPLKRTIDEMNVDEAIEKLANPPAWIFQENIYNMIDHFFPYIGTYFNDEIIMKGWLLNLLTDTSFDLKAVEAALEETEAENFFQFLTDHGYNDFLARYLDQNRPQGISEGSMRL